MDTKKIIIKKAKYLFATQGYSGVSMRDLATTSGITLSNIYHYFSSKDSMLEEIFHSTNIELGKKRHKLPSTKTPSEMLRQRIEFQFTHADDVVYVLKYYLTFRKNFKKIKNGFLPEKTYKHIEEVLIRGGETGEFTFDNLHEDAQVITHAINGFVLEYYPHKVSSTEKERIVNKIHRLLIRALTNHEK